MPSDTLLLIKIVLFEVIDKNNVENLWKER